MDSYDIPAWTYVMLERISQSDYAEIALVILIDAPMEKNGGLTGIIGDNSAMLYVVFRKLEDLVHRPKLDAFEIRNSTSLLGSVSTMKLNAKQVQASEPIGDEDARRIKDYEIDVFVKLCRGTLSGRILRFPRSGVWVFCDGNHDVSMGGPVGLWEVLEGQPATRSTLQMLDGDSNHRIILHASYSSTDPLSVNRNANRCYWKTLSFLPRKLKELQKLGDESFLQGVASRNERAISPSNRPCPTPGNAVLLKLLPSFFLRVARRKRLDLLYVEQWFLMFDFADDLSRSFSRFKRIMPPRDRFWADPLVVYENGHHYVFIEEFLYTVKKGHISVIVMDGEGDRVRPTKVLDRPYHLSYPFVFEWQSKYYMVPESSKNKTVDIYECMQFPEKWELRKTILKNIHAVDPTILNYHGKWWLFANVKENAGASDRDELFLYYSNNPLDGHWHSHPQNPIISDVRKSRPAGRLFERGGFLYRPAQDCSRTYGHRIVINRVLRLDEQEYEETEVDAIEPNWDRNLKAVHTLSYVNGLTVVDGMMLRSKFLS